MFGDHTGALLTAGLAGSFGTMQYALLALATPAPTAEQVPKDPRRSLTEDLLQRGFRQACNGDLADVALKAQPADGSIVCRVSAGGRVSLVVDDGLVWTQRIDLESEENARWIQAARSREVTLISGDHLLITGTGVDSSAAAAGMTLVMGKIPTDWI